MSYDIDLKDRVTGEVIELPIKHVMIGGTYAADYDEKTGIFTPKPISEAHLNITWNYSKYYYEATEGDDRFFGKTKDDYPDEKERNLGICGIYGKTGAESIPMLKDMIVRITEKYSKDGEWIETEREISGWIRESTGEFVELSELIGQSKDGYIEGTRYEIVSEAANSDYWKPTAGNAIKPLFQLITMAQLRPDGVWDGD